jgi:hypothetical protein
MQYGRWPKPPKQVLPAQVHTVTGPTAQAAVQSVQECNIAAGPSTFHHALPGPSGTQVQPKFGDVSLNFISRYFFNLIKYNVLPLNHNKCMHSVC